MPSGEIVSIPSARISRSILLAAALLFPLHTVVAQDRPLQTPDAEVMPAGTARVAVGFDALGAAPFRAAQSGGGGERVDAAVRIEQAAGQSQS